MAPFNPDIKDINPVNPIGWSKPGVVPEKFASVAEAGIKGAASLVGDVTKAADELVKQDAQKAVEDKVNPVRDDYIAQLAAADFSLNLNQAAGGVTQGVVPSTPKPMVPGILTDTGSFDENKAPTPAELKALPQSLELLESAKANGKLSPTAYYGRLMSIASDLRSRYPVGYREYIDKEISKITGVDPANAYIHSILGDINSFMTNHQAEKGKVLSEIMKYQGADPILGPQMYTAVANGTKSLQEGLTWAAKYAAIDYTHQQNTAKFQDYNNGQAYNKSTATLGFRTWTSDQVAAQFDSIITLQGQTPDTIRNITQRAQRGEIKLNSNDYLQLAQNMRGLRDSLASKMFAELNKTGKDRPTSYSTALQGEGNKIIDEALAPYNTVIDALDKKDIGLAYDAHRSVQAFKDQSAQIMFKNPVFAAAAGQLAVVKEMGGESAAAKLLERLLGQGKLNMSPADQKLVELQMANLITAPDARGRDFKEFNSLDEAVTRTDDIEKKLGRRIPSTWREIQNNIDGPKNSLIDPTTPIEIRKATARNYFSPENWETLQKIQPDIRDKNGILQPGRQSWFARFTRPDVAQAIQQLGDPKILKDYNDWVDTNYRALFTEDMQRLGNVNLSPGTRWHLSWDDEDPIRRLKLRFEGGAADVARATGRKLGNETDATTIPFFNEVDKLNKGISGMGNVLRAQGYDENYIKSKALTTLVSNFPPGTAKSINGLPESLIKALGEQARLNKEEEERKKASEAKYKL